MANTGYADPDQIVKITDEPKPKLKVGDYTADYIELIAPAESVVSSEVA